MRFYTHFKIIKPKPMKRPIVLFFVLMLSCLLASAQDHLVKGRVTGPDGNPLQGITVQVKGTHIAAATDANGEYELSVPSNANLDFSGVGFETQSIKISGRTSFDVSLRSATQQLSEVIVTALGIKRDKRTLTYATQEVSGSTLVEAKQDNLVNALAGKVAGVQITNSSGMPGSSARIVIRGVTSLTGDNQALFVIDGVPVDNTEAGNPDNSLFAGSTVNRASDIDPNIIESITVLKGTAATALYGSAAARGAVIITTKTGANKSGKPTVSFSSSYSNEDANLPEFQDKYAQGSRGNYVNGNIGQKGSASWGPLIDTLKVGGVPVQKRNNVKDFFITGHTTDNNVSLSGSTDKSNYLVSYSYLKTTGTEPSTDYSRHAFFVKYGTKIFSNLNLTTQFNYIHSDNHRLTEGNGLANPLWTIYAAPISWDPLPATNPDGSQQVYRAARNNPYWLVNNTGIEDKTDRVLPVVTLTYNPLSWLSVTERLGVDMYVNNTDYHENVGIIGSTSTAGRLWKRENQFQQFNNDLIIRANKNFGNDLSADIVVGNNILTTYNNSSFVQGVGLSIPGFYNISNANSVTSNYGYFKTRKVGFYAQATMEYKRMLILSLTGRLDGSSVLSQDKQFYPYGSASAGFIFTEALGMASNPIMNFGKIRVSYSSVGNDNVGPYALSNPYFHNGIGNITFPYNGINGFQLTTTYGYPIKNEGSKEYEAGIETKFFQNRLSLDVTYFNKKSVDLIVSGSPIAPGTGFSSASINAGDISNKGIEVVLGITPIKTKDFSWEININYSKIKDKVIRLAPGIPYLQFAGFVNPGIYAFANQPYGVIYGSHFLRDSTTGKLLLDDNAYPQIANDLAPIGNVTPKWIGGLTNTLTYKGFIFSFTLDYKNGGDILNLDNHYLYFYGTPKSTENRGDSTVFNGIIQSSGKPNTQKVVLDQNYFTNLLSNVDESSVQDGSYLKLRQASIGYNFGYSFLKRAGVKGLTLTVSATNFILYKNYSGSDPEVSLNGGGNGQGFSSWNVPSSHNVIVGLKVLF